MNISSAAKPIKIILLALAIGAFAIGSDAFIVIGLIHDIARDLNISVAIAGQMVSIFAFCYALCAPIAATLLAGICRKKIMLLTMIFFSVGNMICAMADGFVGLFIGRIIAAIGAAAFTPQATLVASSLVSPERRGAALAVIFGGMTVAGAIGAPLGIYLGQIAGWRAAFIATAILGAITFVLLNFLLDPLHDNPPENFWDILQPARSKTVLLVLSVTFLVVLSEYIIYSYISLILTDNQFSKISILPVALFLFGTGAILGNIATAILTDRLGPRIILLTAISFQTLSMILLVILRDKSIVVLPSAFIWGIFSYMYLVPIQHRLLDITKQYGAFIISLNSSLIYFGISAGGVLGGIFVAYTSLETMVATSALIAAIAIIFVYFSFPNIQPKKDT